MILAKCKWWLAPLCQMAFTVWASSCIPSSYGTIANAPAGKLKILMLKKEGLCLNFRNLALCKPVSIHLEENKYEISILNL